ncbi:hypothetical protein HKX48_002287 [Thoreauomyces humboldtii]|nr:hypothetical protein HKX48_002287 [Thoreauomyces humboldtii]
MFVIAVTLLLATAGPVIYLLLHLVRPSTVQPLLVPSPLIPPLKQFNRLSVLLLIAHPDDECMFFSPTLQQLTVAGADVGVLCLSQGNADGAGTTRRKELVESCKRLGVNSGRVQCLDRPDLQDGMDVAWKASVVADVVKTCVAARAVDVIITFDAGGVSGHPNHKALYDGLRYFMNLPSPLPTGGTKAPPSRTPICYSLTTVTLLRKYLSLFDVGATVIPQLVRGYCKREDGSAVFVALPRQVLAGRKAMQRHRSQLVWFRHLYIVFSRYMVVNDLRRM